MFLWSASTLASPMCTRQMICLDPMGFFKKRLGESPVPGEGTASLPAGKVLINYEEQRKGRSTDDSGPKGWPGIPEGLDITVRPAGGGEPLPIDRPLGSREYANLRQIGSRYGVQGLSPGAS